MAEVTRRRTGEHLRNLFQVLMAHPDGMAARDALAALETITKLTPYEAGDYESGGRRFDKIVRFATVDCVKAGWLLKSKGRWSLTEEGRRAHGAYPDPEEFYKQALVLYRAWRKSQSEEEEAPAEEGGVSSSARAAAITLEEAVESAWAEIEHFLGKMPAYDFQDLVGALLRGLGYHFAWTAPPGKDGGIDIVAWRDALGTEVPRLKVQVKRHAAPVGVGDLRPFLAVLGDGDVGLFVNLGGFTKDAQDEARLQQTRRITLIDMERMFDLWVECYAKLPDEDRRRLPLQPIYFLALD